MSELLVELFDANLHYPTLVQWWATWKFPLTPKEFLPKESGVWVTRPDGQPMAAAFALFPKEPIELAFLEWVTGNPDLDTVNRREAILVAIAVLEELAKQHGHKILLTFTHNEKFKEFLTKEADFTISGQGYTGLIRRIK